MKTLVLGLGNSILSDDGVGIKVAQEVRKELIDPRVSVAEISEAGLHLLDSIVGYGNVIIIDAIRTRGGEPGQIHRMEPEDFSFIKCFSSPHQVNLVTALELGKMLNLAMPRTIAIFAVEAKDIATFGDKCTLEVQRAIPEVVEMVLQELNGYYAQDD